MYADFGKYRPNITYIIPQEWNLDASGNPEAPIKREEIDTLTKNMNIDFNSSSVKVLFGEWWTSKAGKAMFKVTSPTTAKHVLICASWGGAFDRTRGQDDSYAKSIGVDYFRSASSNGGGAGSDYYIVPVDFIARSIGIEDSISPDERTEETVETETVLKADNRELLKKIEEKEKARIEENGKAYSEKLAKKEASIKNKAIYEKQIDELVAKYNELYKKCSTSELKVVHYEDSFEYKGSIIQFGRLEYSEESVNYLKSRIEKLEKDLTEAEEILSKYKDSIEMLGALGFEYEYKGTSIAVKNSDIGFERTYSLNESHIIDFLKAAKEALDRANQEKIKRDEEFRRTKLETEQRLKEESAKKEGYLSQYECRHRTGGQTAQISAFVINEDGVFRQSDYVELDNSNHRYKYDDLHDADGLQTWKQILPGELVIKYEKDYTAAPLNLEIVWVPTEITPIQFEKVEELIDELGERYEISVDELKEQFLHALHQSIPSKLTPEMPEGTEEQDKTKADKEEI